MGHQFKLHGMGYNGRGLVMQHVSSDSKARDMFPRPACSCGLLASQGGGMYIHATKLSVSGPSVGLISPTLQARACRSHCVRQGMRSDSDSLHESRTPVFFNLGRLFVLSVNCDVQSEVSQWRRAQRASRKLIVSVPGTVFLTCA